MKASLPVGVMLFAQVAWGQSLVWSIDGGLGGVGMTSPPLLVQRLDVTGQPITAGALSVTVTSNSLSGGFATSADPFLAWPPSLSTTITAGNSISDPLYFRDGVPALVTLTAVAGGFSSAAASAQIARVGFNDDVETGGLLYLDSPAGRWNDSNLISGMTVAASPLAAHRGDGGVRLTDTSANAGAATGTTVGYFMAPISGSVFARGWVRIAPTSAQGQVEVFSLGNFPVATVTLAGLEVTFPSGVVQSIGADVGGDRSEVSSLSWTPGWHLVELQLAGLETDAGIRRLWLDGQLANERAGLNFGAPRFRVGALNVGENWSEDSSFTGTIDFDDVRVAVSPLASRLQVLGPSTLPVGNCLAFTVRLVDTPGQSPAEAPFATSVILSSGLGTYADHGCTDFSSIVTIPVGLTQATFFGKASAIGPATITAQHLDFLKGAFSVSVVSPSDAGNDGGGPAYDAGTGKPLSLTVGCGCQSSSALPYWLLGVLVLLTRLLTRIR